MFGMLQNKKKLKSAHLMYLIFKLFEQDYVQVKSVKSILQLKGCLAAKKLRTPKSSLGLGLPDMQMRAQEIFFKPTTNVFLFH